MESSVVSDTTDNQVYPDVLSVDFSSFQFKEPPFVVQVNDQIASKPYIHTSALYKTVAYDDVIFNINNVPHLSMVYNFATLNYPTIADLNSFLQKKV
jgi:hypothetical protein